MMAATAATCPPYGSTGWLSILHIEPQIVVLETTAYHSLGIRLLPGRIAESYRCYRYVFEAVDDSNDIALLVINAGIYATANPRMCGPALRQTLHGSK